MIKNYLKTAWRNAWKNKTASVINLFGLSTGMTAAVFIFLWVYNETDYNSCHPGHENIYRITSTLAVNNNEKWVWESSPMLMSDAAQKGIPEIDNAARVVVNTWGAPVFHIGRQLFSEKTSAWVDKTWLDIFHYEFIAGSAAAFSQSPFSIILSESKAKKYFGNSNATGQIIKVDTVNYTVTGVVRDNPSNSSFQFDVLLQMEGRLSNINVFNNDKTWNNFGYITFLKLQPGADTAKVAQKLNAVINSNRRDNTAVISIRSLGDIYFEGDLQSSEMPHGNKRTTLVFAVMGLLLLVTACINYINLTTARASTRAREVSIRKIVGAGRRSLIIQFAAETIVVSFFALLLTIVLLHLLLPVFNLITEKNFSLPLNNGSVWKILSGTLFFTAMLNGIYPAFLLSSFTPLNVFRGKSVLKVRDGFVRKGLVVFQFSLSMILIAATFVVYRQLNFIQKNNPGYNTSQVMSIEIPWTVYSKMDMEKRQTFFSSFKAALKSQSSVAMISSANGEIVNINSSSSGNADWDGRDTLFNPTIGTISIDEDFAPMFQLQLKEGNWFKPNGENARDYILNETAAELFKMQQPIVGQRFSWGGDTGRIAGIAKDFHFKSLHEKIGPLVIRSAGQNSSYTFLKILPGNIQKAVSDAEKVWAAFVPQEPFRYSFLDDSFNRLYKSDIKTSRLVFIFSGITVVIAALGLLALAAFSAEQRIKEIGIRKVLGASVSQIVAMLSKDFLLLVLLASLIALPLAWWLMNKWLQDFAYRVETGWWVFAAAGIIALLIAVLTVSSQAIKAAVSNPVKSLRTE